MDRHQMLLWLSIALFSLGMLGVMLRRNALIMLMCMELMLNGVNVGLVNAMVDNRASAGGVLVFLVFVVATAEMALAIPIILLLVRRTRSLDLETYTELKG